MAKPAYWDGLQTLETETTNATLSWEGSPPAWLNGTLLRNGPGKFEAGAQLYNHWFDGLAMLHRFAFTNGQVTYTGRYLQSDDYRETIAKNAPARDEFATNRAGLLASIAPRLTGKPTDNCIVNVLPYGEHDMVALTEQPFPMRVDPKTLATLGRFEWSDLLRSQIMTAHPHYDAARQLIYNFEIAFGRPTVYRFTYMVPGSHRRDVVCEIETSEPAYTHSFGMSERFLVLAEFPLYTTPLRLLFSGRPYIQTYRWLPIAERALPSSIRRRAPSSGVPKQKLALPFTM